MIRRRRCCGSNGRLRECRSGPAARLLRWHAAERPVVVNTKGFADPDGPTKHTDENAQKDTPHYAWRRKISFR